MTGAVDVVRLGVADAAVDFTSDRGGMWVWSMRIDGVKVAVSAHPYGRRRDAATAVQRFRRGAPDAPLDDWVHERGEQRPRLRQIAVDGGSAQRGGGDDLTEDRAVLVL